MSGIGFQVSVDARWRDLAGRFARPPVGDIAGRAITEAGTQALRTVQAGTPVRTGRARAGWRFDYTPSTMEGHLTNRVPYVHYLIGGTWKMKASESLNEALDKVDAETRARLERVGVDLSVWLAGR